MKRALKFLARLYPARWRDRYGTEFDALLDDISPTFRDLGDVLGDALRARMTGVMDACLAIVPASPRTFRVPVMASLSVHALVITLVLLTIWGHAATIPLRLAMPQPPPVPDSPPQMADARVFPNAPSLYSSLPLRLPSQGNTLRLYVDYGVGINFLPLPDIGAKYQQANVEWRVWPGQALERLIVRRVLPEYPRGANTRGAVSVFVEYLITLNGSVKVLRTSGPEPFREAAQSAIQGWVYRPPKYENHACEIVSRVEIRFDAALARSLTG